MVKISKDMLINDILAVDAGNAAILMAAGMHCIGCLAAAGSDKGFQRTYRRYDTYNERP